MTFKPPPKGALLSYRAYRARGKAERMRRTRRALAVKHAARASAGRAAPKATPKATTAP